MSKKTSWITIPEATLHTPIEESVKGKKTKSESPELVKNKWFWGIGFMVMVVAVFAVMAPKQFSALLKGSLFDTTGLTEEETTGVISPTTLLVPQEKKEETPPEEPAPEAAPEQPVVEPQAEPVNVAVEPITKPEEVQVTPLGTEPVDCKADLACFLPHLKDCTLAKVALTYSVASQDFEANAEITGAQGENCSTKVSLTKSPQADLVGKEAVCALVKGDYTEDSFKGNFTDSAKFAQVCTGDLVTTLKAYLDGLSAASAQAKLVEELQKQVQTLEEQKQQAAETALELVEAVQGQVRPVAETAPVVQPGFRANPYRVSVSPQEMLRRNSAAGVQYAPQTQAYQQPTQQYYQPTPAPSEQTPQTGPAEIIVLALAFLALIGWRFVRAFA